MVGVAYGYWGLADQGMSIESSLLAGGLCSVSGMLPDLDSDSGVPLRETSLFLAAVAPMLMIDRWRDMGLSHEAMALAAMIVYVAIRFVAVEFFRRFTVHRGMWHSIPAALIAWLMAYMVMPCPSEAIRVYKSFAVCLGFMTHLILDEIWAIDLSRGTVRLKKSFGTALKFFGSSAAANFMVWGQLGLLVYLAWGDHGILDRLRQRVRIDQERSAVTGGYVPDYSIPSGSDSGGSGFFGPGNFNRPPSGLPSWQEPDVRPMWQPAAPVNSFQQPQAAQGSSFWPGQRIANPNAGNRNSPALPRR